MDPCGNLTDVQYLHHMIPHHQVAIDMSRNLVQSSRWPELLALARQVLWTQDIEIKIMNAILHRNMEAISDSHQQLSYIQTQGDWTPPNSRGISTQTCDPMFFHSMKKAHVSDQDYISHMIPHHQIAIDMSKRLLLHTKNDYMIDLAYSIIRAQQAEITKFDALKHTNIMFQSELV